MEHQSALRARDGHAGRPRRRRASLDGVADGAAEEREQVVDVVRRRRSRRGPCRPRSGLGGFYSTKEPVGFKDPLALTSVRRRRRLLEQAGSSSNNRTVAPAAPHVDGPDHPDLFEAGDVERRRRRCCPWRTRRRRGAPQLAARADLGSPGWSRSSTTGGNQRGRAMQAGTATRGADRRRTTLRSPPGDAVRVEVGRSQSSAGLPVAVVELADPAAAETTTSRCRRMKRFHVSTDVAPRRPTAAAPADRQRPQRAAACASVGRSSPGLGPAAIIAALKIPELVASTRAERRRAVTGRAPAAALSSTPACVRRLGSRHRRARGRTTLAAPAVGITRNHSAIRCIEAGCGSVRRRDGEGGDRHRRVWRRPPRITDPSVTNRPGELNTSPCSVDDATLAGDVPIGTPTDGVHGDDPVQ